MSGAPLPFIAQILQNFKYKLMVGKGQGHCDLSYDARIHKLIMTKCHMGKILLKMQ